MKAQRTIYAQMHTHTVSDKDAFVRYSQWVLIFFFAWKAQKPVKEVA